MRARSSTTARMAELENIGNSKEEGASASVMSENKPPAAHPYPPAWLPPTPGEQTHGLRGGSPVSAPFQSDPFALKPSWSGLSRPSTSFFIAESKDVKDVDARDKPRA